MNVLLIVMIAATAVSALGQRTLAAGQPTKRRRAPHPFRTCPACGVAGEITTTSSVPPSEVSRGLARRDGSAARRAHEAFHHRRAGQSSSEQSATG
jgi:hypothetical protein